MKPVHILLLIALFFISPMVSVIAEEKAAAETTADLLLEQLQGENKISGQTTAQRMRTELNLRLQEQAAGPRINSMTLRLLAQNVPEITDGTDMAETARIMVRLMEKVDENIRRGDPPVRVRAELQREIDETLGKRGQDAPSTARNMGKGRNRSEDIRKQLKNRGNGARPFDVPPGLEMDNAGSGERPFQNGTDESGGPGNTPGGQGGPARTVPFQNR